MIQTQTKLLGKKLETDLARFEQRVREKVTLSGVAAMAYVIYAEARLNARAHAQSGKLESAIYRRLKLDRSDERRKTYHIGWNRKKAPHGHFLEFGTSRAPAYPFLTPAFSRMNDAIAAGKARMAESLKVAGVMAAAGENIEGDS